MLESELREIISCGETSRAQFKEKLDNPDSIAAEMAAMANCGGGQMFFGIKDRTGEPCGLSYEELQSTGNRIASIASDFVNPQVFVTTEVVPANKKHVLVVSIQDGIAKPYKDRNGCIWVKQGGDKRRLTDNVEQLRLFQQSGLVYIDEMIVPGTGFQDVDKERVLPYLSKIDGDEHSTEEVTENLCGNLNILKDGRLSLAGLLFFGRNPQKYRPAFCVKAVSFWGNDIAGSEYRDSQDITGTIPHIFDSTIDFFRRNLHHTQQGQDFNSTGILEISEIALRELVWNRPGA